MMLLMCLLLAVALLLRLERKWIVNSDEWVYGSVTLQINEKPIHAAKEQNQIEHQIHKLPPAPRKKNN